jgi:hypothetical protein
MHERSFLVQEGGVPSLDPRSNFSREELRAVFDAVDKDGSGEVRTTNVLASKFFGHLLKVQFSSFIHVFAYYQYVSYGRLQ